MDKLLKDIIKKQVLCIGIGNVLKRDDGVGVYISHGITEKGYPNVLTVEVSIENYIGKINSLNKEVLVLIDSMDFKEFPGYWNILSVENLFGHTTNTHNITLDKVSELFNAKTYVLGIQPKNINFGENLTPEVKQSADRIIEQINRYNIS